MVAPGLRVHLLLGVTLSDYEEVGTGIAYFIYPDFITCRITTHVFVTHDPIIQDSVFWPIK